jgi:hypothetical protein
MSVIPENECQGKLISHAASTSPPQSLASVGAADVNQTLALGKVFAESGFFADTRAAAQAVVKVLAGRELGFGPVASMTGVNIIKGRVTLSANLIAAAVRRSGRYDYRVRRLDDQGCEIEFLMSGEVIGMSSFTMDDAKKAGLAGGDNWRKYPRNMLFARAISNGAKWFCPDVFGGSPVYTPDELDPTAKLDPDTGSMVSSLTSAAVDVEVVEAEPATGTEDLPARVAALVAETNTDVSRLLTHYQAAAIDDLTPAQCTEAIQTLTVRKNAQQISVSVPLTKMGGVPNGHDQ